MLPTPPERTGGPDRALVRGMQYAALGIEVAGIVAGTALLGWWLDGKFDTGPWLLLTLVLLGGAAAMLQLFRVAQRLGRQAEAEENESRQKDGTGPTDSEGAG